ncbi:helix-turn-helix domain-containing protein [Modestobacter sp. VKM Ac-2986]|uniref:GlxA family transcriptional regulator n=1 Tax=Modestobacter sp. VKM Ac-2986 TaxID=3004140 RepID=UPI0022AA0C37|nr:helix-turn-helix domain-containing protein [Modestobacter sp. VKM Ac-2986]MCZ2827596.1 helix-turn-helix domain-containing protein [Modestobacter sp. VKM Ac-2986]
MRIAIHAFDGVTMFHLAVPQMVFDEVRRQGLGAWETVLFGDRPGSIRTAEGHRIGDVAGPAAAEDADVVVVPSWSADGRPATPALQDVLRAGHARGATVAGLCLGALAVADAGLLSGRSAVTHWAAFGAMADRHPDVALDTAVLYIDHGDVLTSAGTASGLDACLHLVRVRLGADAANRVARSLVVAPHRLGGQAQYIERPLPASAEQDPIADVQAWALTRLDGSLTVAELAAAAHMSRRTFIRAFQASTGTTPAVWVRSRRLDLARRLLETTDAPVDHVATACGFGSPVTLRQAFAAAFRTSPSDYRRQFSTRSPSGGA